jgi:outer membrane protein assembly factor BamB
MLALDQTGRGMMWPVQSASSDRSHSMRVHCRVAALAALSLASSPVLGPSSSSLTPIHLHGADGWGRPAVHGSVVYYLSRHHELYAVDRDTGATKWRRTLRHAANRGTAGTSVVVERGTVIVGDDDLFAFDAESGVPRWRFSSQVDNGPGPYLGSAAEGVVYAGSASGHVYAIDIATGRPAWVGGPYGTHAVVYAPVVKDGLAVAAYTDFTEVRRGGVVVHDAATGALRWHTPFPVPASTLPSGAAGGPVIANEMVVAASSDGSLHGFRRESGEIAWSLPPLASMGEDYRAGLFRRNMLLVASLSGVLVALNVQSLKEQWRYSSPEDGSIAFDIAADEETVYVPFASGRMTAVDFATGHERWRAGTTHRRFEHVPAIVGEQVYLTTEEGLYVVANRH